MRTRSLKSRGGRRGESESRWVSTWVKFRRQKSRQGRVFLKVSEVGERIRNSHAWGFSAQKWQLLSILPAFGRPSFARISNANCTQQHSLPLLGPTDSQSHPPEPMEPKALKQLYSCELKAGHKKLMDSRD